MVVLRATDNNGNTEVLDILQEGGLFCDISAIESGDIGQVFGISSQEFMLPGSDKNNKFFGNIFDLGATPSVALNHTIYATVMVDGATGFEGRMYINDVLKDDKGYVMYKAVVINETVDFKTRIKELGMADLDLSHLDHLLTTANVTGSWRNELFSGSIVYPLVDYGSADPDTTIAVGHSGDATFNNYDYALPIDSLLPAIRVRDVIDAIFDQVDYTYSSSFFDSEYFDKIYMLTSRDGSGKVPSQDPTTDNVKASYSGSGTPQIITDGSTDTLIMPVEVYDNGNNYNPATGQYTVPFQGKYDVGTYLDVAWASAPPSGQFNEVKLFVNVNGTPIKSAVYYSANASYRPGISATTGVLSPGDVITVTARTRRITTGTGTIVTGASMTVLATNNGSFTTVKPSTNANTVVQMNRMFNPDLKVRDFLQGLIQKFNLVIEPKQNTTRILSIEPFNTWRDSGVKKDWTNKIDHSVRKSVQGTMIDQAHIISFADEEDKDYLNKLTQDSYGKVFGEALFTDSSDLTEGKKEIGSFFSPTPVTAIEGSSDVAIPLLYEVDSDGITKKPFAFNPRILHFNGRREINSPAYAANGSVNGTGFWLSDLDGNVTKHTAYGSFHYLELEFDNVTDFTPDLKTSRDLNFNNSQQYHFVPTWLQSNYYVERDAIYEYWAQYINELYTPESRRLICNVFFNPEEIREIQLNDQVYIDGHYYRIDNISNFSLTEPSSTQVTLIKAPVRKFNYPVRRIYDLQGSQTGITGSNGNDIGGTYTDLTVDPTGGLSADGNVTYVDVGTGLPPTGSGNQGKISRAATLDRFAYVPNDSGSAIWNTNPLQPTVPFRNQVSVGNNEIEFSANNVSALGSGNVIKEDTTVINLQGSANTINNNSEFINVQGDSNTVESFAKKSSIISSTNSTISEYTEYGAIIGGEDSIISGSNKSVLIGQDIVAERGNSNIIIGNYDSQTKTVKDMINTVVINPNRDVESYENISGSDFNGRAYIGSNQEIGAKFSDNITLTLSAGATLYLTGSDYVHTTIHNVTWTGGAGTATVYLPPVDENPFISRDANGYKRLMRFISDSTLDSSKQVIVNVATGDSINGQFNGWYTLDAPFENLEIYGIEDTQWRILEAGISADQGGGHEGSYGSFYSTQTQTIAASGSAQLVTMNSTFASNNIALSGSGGIQMDYNGAYSFTYTAKVQNADNVIHYADFWIKYNGTDYPNSSVRAAIPARKNSSEFTLQPVTIQLLDVAVSNGDVIELYWRGDSTLLSLQYETFGGSIPNAPSMRATIHAV